MSRLRNLVCSLFLIFFSSFIFSAELMNMQFYQAADKLPSMAISSISQDSSGTMYFGTRGSGLVKYDGNSYKSYTWEPFSVEECVPSVIQCMLMDSNDVLFLGTYSGISRFDTKTGKCNNYKICNEVVCCLLRDSRGRLWAGTLDGLALVDEYTGKSITFSNREPVHTIGNNTIRGLYEDSKARIFACTYDGIFVYDEVRTAFVRPDFITDENPLSSNVVYAVEESSDGSLWASAWGTGLVKTDTETGAFTVYPLPNNAIYCMSTAFLENSVIAGTWGGGLHVLDTETGYISSYSNGLNSPYALPNDTIYSLYKDSLGLLWIGTNGGGVVTYDKNRAFLQPVRFDSLQPNSGHLPIQNITADANENLWILLKNKGVLYYNPATGDIKEYSPDNGTLKSYINYTLYITDDGDIYLGSDSGLSIYNPKTDSFESVLWYSPFLNEPESRMVYYIRQTSDGLLWIGTYGAGIIQYDPIKKRYKRYVTAADNPQSLISNVIYFIVEDSRNNIWIGTNSGLNRYKQESDTFKRYVYDAQNRSGIGGSQIVSFCESQDGTLWFASNDGGITAMNPETERFSTYTRSSGLPSNIIAGMVEIAPDMFWVTTGNGLVLFDRRMNTMQVYTTADGLPSNQFASSPIIVADGTVWFGTSNGLVYLPAQSGLLQSRRSSMLAARSVLTDVAVNGVPVSSSLYKPGAAPYVCLPQERNITISFASLDFSPLARPLFSYQLEGFSDDWIMTNNEKTVQYINLPAGMYTFRVKDTDPLYELPDEGAAFSFIIQKPVYMRWYFVLLYAAAGLIVLYVVVKVRDFILLKRKILQLEALARSLHDSNLELQQLSCTDVLTGISNRRGFEQLVPDLWREAVFQDDIVALMMVDIDYFKDYNDTYGHPDGDKVLKMIAKKITSVLGKNKSIVCRYGGEEFLVMVISPDFNEILRTAEKIRLAVESLKIKGAHPGHELVTVSVGVFITQALTETDWSTGVSFADLALYEAKKGGRNCVKFFNPSLIKE